MEPQYSIPLFNAVVNYMYPVVEILIKLGIDVNQQDKSGNTVLHNFFLLESNESIDDKNFDLKYKEKEIIELEDCMSSERLNKFTIIKLLMDKADLSLKNNVGATPVNLALNNNWYFETLYMVHLLGDKFTNSYLLINATTKNWYNLIKKLLNNKNINPNIQDCHGNTSLHVLLIYSESMNEKKFYEHDPLHPNYYGFTREREHIYKCAKLLIDSIDVTIKNKHGDSPLNLSTKYKYLLESMDIINKTIKLIIN